MQTRQKKVQKKDKQFIQPPQREQVHGRSQWRSSHQSLFMPLKKRIRQTSHNQQSPWITTNKRTENPELPRFRQSVKIL